MAQSQSLVERDSEAMERWDPFGDLDQLNDRMRRMLEQTFSSALPLGTAGWSPLVDIEEQDDAYVLEADAPGAKREDVKVEQVGNELHISGEIKERERKGSLRRRERPIGRFSYAVRLPESIDPNKIEAKLKDGVLSIRVPKSQRAQRRQVEVTS
ncbi:MAG TPA: Hsp20/alpha crystallin family protein [Galbitalea sp.]|jgi:HSP20 family protein